MLELKRNVLIQFYFKNSAVVFSNSERPSVLHSEHLSSTEFTLDHTFCWTVLKMNPFKKQNKDNDQFLHKKTQFVGVNPAISEHCTQLGAIVALFSQQHSCYYSTMYISVQYTYFTSLCYYSMISFVLQHMCFICGLYLAAWPL